MERVTIKDIASAAGVSVGTVSKVLNGDLTVKEKNRKAVEFAIAELDYNVNNVARSLARKPIKLGVVMPYPFEGYFGPMIDGIQKGVASLSDHKVDAVFCNCPLHSDEQHILECLRAVEEKAVNGILFGPFYQFSQAQALARLEKQGIPAVLMLSNIDGAGRLAYVGIDAALSGKTAADLTAMVLQPGDSCAVFVGNLTFEEHRQKADSFLTQIRERTACEAAVYETRDDAELAYRQTMECLTRDPALRLIYVATANSVSVCKAICDCGRADRVKVIATDIWPALKPYIEQGIVVGTLDQHLAEQGTVAVKTLHRYLTENIIKDREIKIAPSVLLYSGMTEKIAKLD